MLIGEYESQIGDKNRIAVPKKLRDNLTGDLIITRGYERCLILVDMDRWNSLIQEINKKPLLSLNVRDTKRFILGGAVEIDPDKQGRFVIPEPLKNFAQIEDKITFLGIGAWIEIWDFDRWQTKLKSLSNNVADIAERLSQVSETK